MRCDSLWNLQPRQRSSAGQQDCGSAAVGYADLQGSTNLAVNSAGHQTADFFLGLTVVGAPVAYVNDKARARAVFADCMRARGYVVTLPDESAPTTGSTVATNPPSVPGAEKLALALPPGFAMNAVPDALAGKGIVFYAVNRSADTALLVKPVLHEGITDLTAYAMTTRANQADRLNTATWSEVTHLEGSGRNAVRYSVAGISKNVKLTYLTTLIEGHDQIVIINAWTGATNALQQMTMLESLAGMVSGIS